MRSFVGIAAIGLSLTFSFMCTIYVSEALSAGSYRNPGGISLRKFIFSLVSLYIFMWLAVKVVWGSAFNGRLIDSSKHYYVVCYDFLE